MYFLNRRVLFRNTNPSPRADILTQCLLPTTGVLHFLEPSIHSGKRDSLGTVLDQTGKNLRAGDGQPQ